MDPQTDPLPDPARMRRNAWLLCAIHAVHMGMFPIAIFTLFLRGIGLSMFDVFLLQALFGAAIAALEFPAGYVADRLGYKRALQIAAGLQVVGFFGYVLADGFATALLAELVLAVAIALISGADSALLYESLLALGEEGTFGRWFGRYRSIGNAAEGSAALLGSLLFVQWPRLPFALQAGLWIVALGLAALLVEPRRTPGPVLSTRERLNAIARYAAFEAPRLRSVVALIVALTLPTYTMVWILPVYVAGAGVSPAWLGPIWALASYTVALGSIAAPAIGARLGLPRALLGCVALIAIGYLGLSLSHGPWGFCFYFALCINRGVQLPLLHHEEQRLIPSSDRASLLSLNSLVFRAAFALLGPVIGHALDAYATHDVLLVVGGWFSAAAFAAWLWFRRARAGEPSPAARTASPAT